MLTVIMIFLGIAVLLLFDGVLENYFPTTKEYSIQSPRREKSGFAYGFTRLLCGRQKG